MNILKLTIKKEYFDMIYSEEKKEEYREIKPYWFQRLVFDFQKPFEYCTGYKWSDDLYRIDGVKYICLKKKSMIGFIPFTHVEFRNGYSKKAAKITCEFKGIEIKTGNTNWGAIENEQYFVIKLGDIVKVENIKKHD